MEAMRRFRLADRIIEETAQDLPDALAHAYRHRIRPLCLCKESGLAMYIAQVGDQYIVKRMPLSGSAHDAACPSYDPPDELSGLGVLMGGAIQVDPESGLSALKVGFSLTKVGARATPVAGADGADSVAGETKKLTLRSLLHYLWHQAELTAWTSRWAGKRHWWNIRWHLREAARQMTVKGGMLSDVLFAPEPFRSADKAAIEQRRAMAMAPALPPRSGPRKLMILLGEVKDISPARAGHRLIVKHMPDFPFMLNEELHRRLRGRFENELMLWSADEASHLMAIATFGLSSSGLAVMEEMALMVVSENWIPYDSIHEKKLVDSLAKLNARSVKGLRYSMPADRPSAAAMLQREPRPLALYIIPPSVDRYYEEALEELIASRPEVDAWTWRVADGEMPLLMSR
jgi:hypothetical protein